MAIDRQIPKQERKAQIEKTQAKRKQELLALKEAYLVAVEKDAVVQNIIAWAKETSGRWIAEAMNEADRDAKSKKIDNAYGVSEVLRHIKEMAKPVDSKEPGEEQR